MGCERRVVYDLINVVNGEAKLSQTLIKDKHCENLFVLPASQTRDKDALTEEGVERCSRNSSTWASTTWCATPAGIERGAVMALTFADEAVVVSQPRSLLGARLRPHPRHHPVQIAPRPGGQRAGQGAPAGHPLLGQARRRRRNALPQGHPGAAAHSAHRRHPRVRERAPRFQPGHPAIHPQGHRRSRSPMPTWSPASSAKTCHCALPATRNPASSSACSEASEHVPTDPAVRRKKKKDRVHRKGTPAAHHRPRAHRRQHARLPARPAKELIQVISKYVKVNPEDINVQLEKQGNYEVLEVNIVLADQNR